VAGGSCFMWLHTHAADGIVHIESPVTRTFTLVAFVISGASRSAAAVSARARPRHSFPPDAPPPATRADPVFPAQPDRARRRPSFGRA
jgi:hypothetical protein